MSSDAQLIFPDLMYLEDFNNNFSDYFKAVYAVFEHDFIKSQPKFNQLKVSAPKYPLADGIHRTFYHITHEGEDEKDRKPDLRRMERIRFPKFLIVNGSHPDVLIWKNIRGKDTRVLLFNEKETYLTVLTERAEYYLLWTAYFVEKEHSVRKLKKEYEAYIKTKTA
ncbi:MAG: hypothetical protein Q7W54_11015 [Bacteroidota bacterium]|nr:hypothetical protein [Bacteroidota bacterium]